jgi:hypothetical protein
MRVPDDYIVSAKTIREFLVFLFSFKELVEYVQHDLGLYFKISNSTFTSLLLHLNLHHTGKIEKELWTLTRVIGMI